MYSVLSVRLSLCLCVCNAVCVCVCGKQERERVWVRKSARVLEEEEMSDASGDDEAMCPLCTEEMDVTDRSINFCKCGYQLCLWCWHHLMETAAKDNAVGRCPNCRTPYDPERITMEKVDPKELEKTRRQSRATPKPQGWRQFGWRRGFCPRYLLYYRVVC